MTITGLLLFAALIMKVWPETPTGRWLCATLVDRPLFLLSRIRRRHLIFLVVGVACMFAFAEIGMPHLAMVAAVDVSLYVDMLITATTIAALNRSRGVWMAFAARFPRLRWTGSRPRRRRQSTPVARKPATNDDDGHGDWAIAA